MTKTPFRCGHPKTPDNVLHQSGQTRCKFCRRKRDRERCADGRHRHLRKTSGLWFRCGHAKTEDNTIFDKSAKGTIYKRCATCRHKRDRERMTPERRAMVKKWVRETAYDTHRNRKRSFKMSPSEYEAMFASQDSKCAACGSGDFSGHRNGVPHIDHDSSCCPTGSETCGKCVRGILCWRCNLALGMVKDEIARLEGLIAYLKRWQEKRKAA